jgi:PAS domain S-box-containing protein
MWKNLSIIVAAITIFAVVIFYIVDIHITNRQVLIADAKQNQLVIAKLTAHEIESYFNDRKHSLQILSSLTSVQNFDNKEMPRSIERYFKQVQSLFVTSISVYNEKGTIVFSTNGKAIGLNYSSYDFFQFAKKKENIRKAFVFPLMEDIQQSKNQRSHAQCIITVPVYQEQTLVGDSASAKKFVGIISMAISLENMITEKFRLTRIHSPKQNVTVFDSDGAILNHPTSSKAGMKNVLQRDSSCFQCHSSFSYEEKMFREKEGTAEIEFKNDDKKILAYSFITVENATWLVAVHQPMYSVTALSKNAIKEMIILLAFIVVVVLGSSLVIYRNHLRKIRAENEMRELKEKQHLFEIIQSSHTLLQTTFDSIPDAIIITDGAFNVVAANNATKNILGYTTEEIVGKSYTTFVAPEMFTDERHKVRQKILYERGFLEHEEFLFIRKNGEVFHASYSVALVRDAKGNVTSLVGSIRDTTERKRMETALHESETKYRTLVETMNEGILVTNSDDKILYVNNRFCAMVNVAAEELLGKTGYEILIRPEQREKIIQMNQRLLTGISDRYEMEMVRKSGEPFWVFISATPLMDAQQNVVGSIAIITDINERKRAEERYRSFFENDLSGDFIADVHGNILACNPAFVRMFGGNNVEETMRWNLKDFFPEQKEREKILDTIGKEKKSENQELELVRCDGKIIHVIENEVGIFNEQDKLIQTYGYIIDITGRKTLEEQLRQAQKLESVGTLAGGIAHDLNNILTIILGHSSLLKRAKGNPEKIIQSADAISKAVDRGAGVIRQLLTFARKTDVLYETVNINDSVEEILKMLHETFPRTIEFSSNLDRTIPNISADRNQIYQALLNLCLNARDAIAENGSISIATQLVSREHMKTIFYDASDNEYARVCISDTGTGMSEEIQSRIFEPFFTTKEKGKGTGLGLSVVFGIIKSHHGFINVESALGKGTTFCIYLPIPLRAVELSEFRKDEQHEIPVGRETIFVIEDEEALLDLVKYQLESNGYTVLTAKDGEAAVSIYYKNAHAISLVLSDLGLPKLGGWEAFLKMKDFNPKIKTIFASGYIAPHQKSEYLKSGVKDFIQKPYSTNEILRKVREVIEIPAN